MKTMKRTLSVLLAMMMALALAIPAFAAAPANYSITINNDQAGHTYEAYQIFAGDVASDEPTDGATNGPILSNITWGNGVNGEALLVALKEADEKYGDCVTAADVAEALGAEGATAADAAAFADIASIHLTTATGTANAPVNGAYVIEGLPGGYYLVKDQDDSLDNEAATATDYIVQVLGNVTMEPKDSDIPTVEKKVAEQGKGSEGKYNQDGGYGMYYNDVADWNIGDRVPFKLIGSIPDMTAYETYQYIFTDTISAGLTLDMESFDVYVAHKKNEDPVALGWTEIDPKNYNLTQTATGFTLEIENLKNFPYVNEEGRNYILVFYDAVLNEDAEIGLPGNTNEVYLQFSNDPNGDGLGQTAADKVIVFTYELDGTKVDAADPDIKLEDAQFVLLNGGRTEAAMVVNGQMTGWIQVATDGANDDALVMPATYEEWVDRYGNNNVILTSDENGRFNISGLDDGTYYLREIKAPTGYNLLEEDVEIVISATTDNGQEWTGDAATALTALTISVDGGEVQNGVVNTGVVELTVANNQGATLPETGGMGTTLFYIIGGVLVLGVVVILVARKRAER